MIDRSNEIIRQLNRIANDRSITPHTRNKIREAVLHIKDLHAAVGHIRDLHLKLKEFKHDQVTH